MEKLKTYLEQLNKIDVASLRREGRDFSFADVYHFIVTIFGYLQKIQLHPEFWDWLPKEKQNNLTTYTQRFLEAVTKIQNFDPTTMSNPQGEREGVSRQIESSYNEFFDQVFPRLDVFVLSKQDPAKKVEDVLVQAKSQLEAISSQKTQGDEILKTLRETSAQTGVSKFAGIFGEQANKHGRNSWFWLALMLLGGVGMGLYIHHLFSQFAGAALAGTELHVVLQGFFAKILILSFFSLVFYQIARNYNANKHLETLNRHRENSLKTFESFVQATTDVRIRDAILLQATRTIFEAGETGYVFSKSEGLTSMETVKIVEQLDGKK